MDDVERVCSIIVDRAVRLHQRLGPGLYEHCYEELLALSLAEAGCSVGRQMKVDFEFDGLRFERGFCIDLLVDDIVLIELKSVSQLAPVHIRQLLTYLRLMDLRVGFVLNFGMGTMREGIRRISNDYRPPRLIPPPRVFPPKLSAGAE